VLVLGPLSSYVKRRIWQFHFIHTNYKKSNLGVENICSLPESMSVAGSKFFSKFCVAE